LTSLLALLATLSLATERITELIKGASRRVVRR